MRQVTAGITTPNRLVCLTALAAALALAGCGAHRAATAPDGATDLTADGAIADAGEEAGDADAPPDIASLTTAPIEEPLVEPASDEIWSPLTDDPLAVVDEPAAPEATASDPAQLVAEALEAVDAARTSWEQGDISSALATLDSAYGLLLQIPDDEPDLTQEKEDLRHLISRRVVEIYRSRLTSAVDLASPIPVQVNAYVEREIQSFQGGERQFFIDSYRRSGLYRPMIVRMLRERGLPEELSWLPLVESGFKTRALSRARALGMWQFISSTGYRYGLTRSHWIDERMDPEKSTGAAIEYLTELHGMFGDWMLALAGYNCGENRVVSVIRRQRDDYLDHFWDVFEQLPRETARYVPRFLATLLIVRNPEQYGFELPELLPPVGYETVSVTRHVRLDELGRGLGLDNDVLVELNPELRRGVTPDTTYALRVPLAAAPTFQARLAELPVYTPPEDTYTIHRVRRGETLSTIARRHGSSINAIVQANNLRSRNRIREGQRLRIPTQGATASAPAGAAGTTGDPVSLTHSVRRGDSLWKLASRYGTTVDRIKRDNGLRSDRLYVGQRLRISSGPPVGSRTYSVQRGDTIGRIARAHSVSLHAVLQANGLSRSSTIYPGQVLIIP
ncbi:MAG TPA: LysM peptidoglycan-binding domain-containing protein [Candidatus Polarisedimenticolaceae bacterium]|nr:LysM peptidoglycan-binding domain-containing protein [Candidatus Polarisedimenticolaceae bacterium]